jgi:hypothetical protein
MTKTPEELAEEFAEFFAGERRKTIAKKSWWTGYEAAKEHAHAALEEAEVKLDQAPQWISVKDRLPEINNRMSEDVLMLNKYGQMGVKPFEIMNNKIVVDWGEAGTRPLSDFTHWMPLPAAPEEDK